MARYVSNHQSAAQLISELKSFNGNSMSGVAFAPVTTARMPREWSRVYHSMRERIIYVVKSWNTPIAWLTADNVWYFPSVSYSGYTSRHQSLTRQGIWQWLIKNGHTFRADPQNFREGDQYATYNEMCERWSLGLMVPKQRAYAYTTPRGIRNGDYVQFPHIDDDGRYRVVYEKFSEIGYAGKRVYYAVTMIDGKRVHTYLGQSDERNPRLR